MATPSRDLRELCASFQLPGDFQGGEPWGEGHINETYRVSFGPAAAPRRFILQRLNPHVFPDPDRLMENVARVLAHSRSRLDGHPDAARRALTLIPTRDGGTLHRDPSGGCWRAYRFVERTRTVQVAETAAQAYQAGCAFGEFLRLLADLPGGPLHETIPNFHHTPGRLRHLLEAASRDPLGRAAEARPEIDFVLARQDDCRRVSDLLARGELPVRVTHNDTKLNNVLLDEASGEAVCVVDLDTVMPGSALYDFGDLVRTTTATAPEDEPDPSRMDLRPDFFAALREGYLERAGDILTALEHDLLAFSGKLITLEIGMRFLTDHLDGDRYFKIRHPGHNRVRARAQFALVAALERRLAP